MTSAAFTSSAASCTLDIPFIGSLDVTWKGLTRGRTWFDTAGIVDEPMHAGAAELWAGRLHLLFCRDTSIRPMKRSVALAALVAVEVARWVW